MKKILFLLILVLSFININAQEVQGDAQKTVIISNSIDTIKPHVRIKWFVPQIYFTRGISIYRKTINSDWVKVNNNPFKKGEYDIPVEAYNEDSTLNDYVSYIDGLAINEIEGLTKAMIFIKGIQSKHYARYIGIEYHDFNVEKGQQYQYKVCKITSSGEEIIGISQFLTVQKHIPYNAPEEVQVKAGDEQVMIKWKPDQIRFYGVNIYKKQEGEKDFKKINDLPVIITKRKGKDGILAYPDIFFTDDSLANGIHYYYKVAGLDYFGRNTKFSQTFKVMPKDKTAPPSPKFLKNKVDLLKVNLSWENVYAPDIKGLRIYRSIHHDTDFVSVHKSLLTPTTSTYTDAVEKPGKYYYYVAAVDSSGNEAPSFLTLANVMDIYPPAQPKGLYALADTGVITLHWNPNTEEDLRGYQVYRTVDKDKKNRYVLLNSDPFIDTTFVDSLPFTAKNKFFYRVAALDSSFNRSEYSDFAMNFMPDIVPPAQPFIKNIVITDKNYLQIQWLPNVDIDIKGYDIYRENKDDTLNTKQKLNETLLSSTVKHFTDRWVEQGITYNYYLVAKDSSGNKSEFSNPFPGKLPVTKPILEKDAFKFINIKHKGDYNLVRWEIALKDDILGAIVYRKDEEGIYRPLTGLMKENKFKDYSISKGKTYHYQLRLYHNQYGELFSDEESITMPVEEEKNE